MIKLDQQVETLRTLEVGNVFEEGNLIPGLPGEELVWRVMTINEGEKVRTVTFSLYLYDIWVGDIDGTVSLESPVVHWEAE